MGAKTVPRYNVKRHAEGVENRAEYFRPDVYTFRRPLGTFGSIVSNDHCYYYYFNYGTSLHLGLLVPSCEIFPREDYCRDVCKRRKKSERSSLQVAVYTTETVDNPAILASGLALQWI